MKKAIVTGAGGFIGGALTELLLSEGWKVYGVDIKPIAADRFSGDFTPVCVDLRGASFPIYLPEPVDVVFNLALIGSMKSPDIFDAGLQTENISAAVSLYEKLSPLCHRFLFVSSTYERMREMGSLNIPVCPYGIGKKAAADLCAAIALRKGRGFVKVVLTNTYGVGDRSDKAVNTMIQRMLNKEPLRLVEGTNRNDWMYIDDTVKGLLAAAEKGRNYQEYYIGHRAISTFREKLTVMRDALCPDTELNFGSMPENTYIDYDAFDLDALYRDTGFECTADFKESILKTAAWVKNNL